LGFSEDVAALGFVITLVVDEPERAPFPSVWALHFWPSTSR